MGNRAMSLLKPLPREAYVRFYRGPTTLEMLFGLRRALLWIGPQAHRIRLGRPFRHFLNPETAVQWERELALLLRDIEFVTRAERWNR